MPDFVPNTARATLHRLASLVAERMQPLGRAEATAGTLRAEGDIAGSMPLALADALVGFRILAQPRAPGEPGNVTGRRETCREFAGLIGPAPVGGEPLLLAAAYRAVERQFYGSDDDRQAAIANRAGREASEIEEVFALRGVTGAVTWLVDRGWWLLQVGRVTAPLESEGPSGDAGETGRRLAPLVERVLAAADLLEHRPVIAVVDPDGKRPYADVLDMPTPIGGYAMAQLIVVDGHVTVAVPMGGTETVL